MVSGQKNRQGGFPGAGPHGGGIGGGDALSGGYGMYLTPLKYFYERKAIYYLHITLSISTVMGMNCLILYTVFCFHCKTNCTVKLDVIDTLYICIVTIKKSFL